MNKEYLIQFPKIIDSRGNISFVQNKDQIPFDINRVYWIYDVPGGEVRGGHAYYKLEEIIISLSGSFDVVVDSGDGKKEIISLNRSYKGLYIPKMMWRQLRNFSTNSVALILASRSYDKNDYIYDYNDFSKIKSEKKDI